jgi:hypothetical protein
MQVVLEQIHRLEHQYARLPLFEFLRDESTPGCVRMAFFPCMIQNRLLAHRLTHLIQSAEPVVRLAITEAIEKKNRVELRYLGELHFKLDSTHAMHEDHANLSEIALDVQQRRDAMQRVDLVFYWSTVWTHELLAFAKAVQPAG